LLVFFQHPRKTELRRLHSLVFIKEVMKAKQADRRHVGVKEALCALSI
jgi:hypothetical protein